MNCLETKKYIHAYLDGELDAAHGMAVESHLRDCADCARVQRNQQSLKSALGGDALHFKMPYGLRRSIVSELRRTVEPEPRRPLWWFPWTAGATALAAALVAILIVTGLNSSSSRNRLFAEITASHVRSMLANHLKDVESTDQHTVKPWLDARLDFAPPVKNLAADGFPLVGGRLDYLDGHSVAALVYMRQKHVINLLIWPSSAAAQAPWQAATSKGYHLANWAESGMTFWAVSDLNQKELLEFAEAFRSK